jgi:hypothetical protein
MPRHQQQQQQLEPREGCVPAAAGTLHDTSHQHSGRQSAAATAPQRKPAPEAAVRYKPYSKAPDPLLLAKVRGCAAR